eukprot:9092888-Pyramimonas_sp.AAC.3
MFLFDSVSKYVDARLVHVRHQVSRGGIGVFFPRTSVERAPFVGVVRMIGSVATVAWSVLSCPDNAPFCLQRTLRRARGGICLRRARQPICAKLAA